MISKIFIGGSRISNLNGKLPEPLCSKLDSLMAKNYSIFIGDADGIDKLVQDYLCAHDYKNVTIYYSGTYLRNKSDSVWKVRCVSNEGDGKEVGRKMHTLKDRRMAELADAGYMIWADTYINKRFGNKCVSSGTMANIATLLSLNKPVIIYFIPQNKEIVINNFDDFNSKVYPHLDTIAKNRWDKDYCANKKSQNIISLFD